MGKFSKDNVKQELVEWGIMDTPSQGGELALSTSAKRLYLASLIMEQTDILSLLV